MNKATKTYPLMIVFCIVLVFGCVLVEAVLKQNVSDEMQEAVIMVKDQYNGYGLEVGRELSVEKIYEDEALVCYADRVFKHFQYDETNTPRIVDIVEGLLERCPDLENVYVLPVPHRVLLEEGYDEDRENYQKYMTMLSQQLPENGVLVDVLPALEEHKKEYVFFRTEDSWTARGAYYGTDVLCQKLGLDAIPLEEYEEYMYTSFFGGLTLQEKVAETVGDLLPEDLTYYYLLQGSVNQVEVFSEDDNGRQISYKKPLITFSARNLGTFIDSSYSRAIVEGESYNGEKEGEYLLVICDSAGKLTVPYLKDYYEGIYVVSVKDDYQLYNDINEIVQQYNIKDVLFAQRANEMGVEGYYRALSDF